MFSHLKVHTHSTLTIRLYAESNSLSGVTDQNQPCPSCNQTPSLPANSLPSHHLACGITPGIAINSFSVCFLFTTSLRSAPENRSLRSRQECSRSDRRRYPHCRDVLSLRFVPRHGGVLLLMRSAPEVFRRRSSAWSDRSDSPIFKTWPVGMAKVSNFSIKLIKRWVELSKAPTNPTWIPSRLVDVSALSTGTVYIKHRQDIPLDDRRYLALSHCWGPADFRTYNNSTKEMFESRIPLDEMAKTFKDLFWLASQLSIPYVWIDTLCILQNDSDDWYLDASTMSQVYLSATLTVVAAASWSSTEGLFRAAQSLRKNHCLLYGRRDKQTTDDSCAFAWVKSD
jgi:hypothetical protein